MKQVATWFLLFLTTVTAAEVVNLRYNWSRIEYDYPSLEARQAAIDSGEFEVGRPIPIDVDVHYANKYYNPLVFITTPRFRTGVPAVLGTITSRTFEGNPIVAPYPSWDWHRNATACPRDRIVSVYRVEIDECGRLWVADNGRLLNTRICPAQVLAFDLKTRTLIHRYEIPDDQLELGANLVTPIVDVRNPSDGCWDTFVYIADIRAYSLIVHDVNKMASWKIQDKTFYPHPPFGSFNILGTEFELMDGIVGLALSPLVPGQDRILYYHSMTSRTENWVSTANLRNQSLFESPWGSPQVFNTYRDTRTAPTGAMAMAKNGVVYFGLFTDTSINCWNTKLDYNMENIDELYRNETNLQFASGIKIITNALQQEELWVMTDRFPRAFTNTLDTSDINFRIHSANVEDLVCTSTKCSPNKM